MDRREKRRLFAENQKKKPKTVKTEVKKEEPKKSKLE
jgi:hypothetical protein